MKKIILLAVLTLCSLPTLAARKDGAYFGFSFGLSNTRTVNRSLTDGGNVGFLGKKLVVTGSNGNDATTMLKYATSRGEEFRITAGYRIWEKFAFEFAFDSFGDAEFRETDGDKMFNNEYALGAFFVGRFPFIYSNYKFVPRLGYSYIRSNLDFKGTINSGALNINSAITQQSESVSNVIYGVGLAYGWNKKADLTLDWYRYNGTGKIDDIDVVQIGMIYHFVGEM